MLGLAYALFVMLTHIAIPCPFRLITGFKCPGCGATHYAMAMIHMNPHAAFEANQFLFFLAPVGLLYGIYRTWLYVRYDKHDYSIPELVVLTLVLIGAIVFGIYRNIF